MANGRFFSPLPLLRAMLNQHKAHKATFCRLEKLALPVPGGREEDAAIAGEKVILTVTSTPPRSSSSGDIVLHHLA